jgi:cobalt-zinc-cadmium efflux system membrane fusion protein
VYKVNGHNQFDMLEVTAGESENGFTEIIFRSTEDMSKADFVTKGAYSLLMMMKNKAE